jgi:shikimate dehydrogenase
VLPEELRGFFARARRIPIAGMSVTIPHKQAVARLADQVTQRARDVGAVNTLFWREGELWGENTDVSGIVEPLRALKRDFGSALVLGAGGAARAAMAGLVELGVGSIAVANRSLDKAEALARDFKATAIPWGERLTHRAGLLVNATPLGMSGSEAKASPMPASALDPACVVFDLVYNPLETVLLRSARARGCKTVAGLEMFLHQGLGQFRLWTGLELNPARARALLLDALAGL